ncbi:hypothetical protein [Nodularia sp. NIES-3585]|uniref:hypothetical protein n=1 Tax=Nodularia sp. NIES-3585 TaxID=1973477 RepID=UPI000B5CB336|nr:hypothetical protein [Nodularia sp. NIES-3585]GAX38675.1 hypothetical protein NIES3585_47250 [Nodularia sp. NIES-3585]
MATEIQAYQKTPVSSFAEIWECPKTEAKSLHATAQFLPGDIIHQIEVKKYVKKLKGGQNKLQDRLYKPHSF